MARFSKLTVVKILYDNVISMTWQSLRMLISAYFARFKCVLLVSFGVFYLVLLPINSDFSENIHFMV